MLHYDGNIWSHPFKVECSVIRMCFSLNKVNNPRIACSPLKLFVISRLKRGISHSNFASFVGTCYSCEPSQTMITNKCLHKIPYQKSTLWASGWKVYVTNAIWLVPFFVSCNQLRCNKNWYGWWHSKTQLDKNNTSVNK